MSFVVRHNMSLVTLIVARHRTGKVLNELLANGVHHAHFSAGRGTLIQDKWYQSLLPMISPELEVIQMVVPDPKVDEVMELAVVHANLRRSGAGAVYCVPCDDLYARDEFPLWPLDERERRDEDASMHLNENMTMIQYISQGERTDAICRSAMNVGSHGPVVQYSEGQGLRDRLGWLKITSKPIKEAITVLVDNVDANLVFAAMAKAGQVQLPGHGLIFSMPVQKAIVNIDTVYSQTRHAASAQQIIKAIDDLKGNKEWRAQSEIDMQGGQAAGLDFMTRSTQARVFRNMSRLTIIVARSKAGEVSRKVQEFGAPGVNIDHAQYHQPEEHQDTRKHTEMSSLRIIMNTDKARALQKRIAEEIDLPLAVFTQPIGQALFYRTPVDKPDLVNARYYRGQRVSG
jgi:nitrogen regulatory protein PII